ncbi:MAG: ferritin-like domain-containing protein [Chloroflexota bacterium]
MGTKGRAIVGLDVNKLIDLLNSALADEWLAYYQYWIGAKVAKGPMKDAVVSELTLHATEELAHAESLSMRIIQLGGTPNVSPKDWFEKTHCGYEAPLDPYVGKLLEQNIKGEQCAIDYYEKLLELTVNKDPVTYNIILTILQQEVEHEEDLQALQEDLEMLVANVRR